MPKKQHTLLVGLVNLVFFLLVLFVKMSPRKKNFKISFAQSIQHLWIRRTICDEKVNIVNTTEAGEFDLSYFRAISNNDAPTDELLAACDVSGQLRED